MKIALDVAYHRRYAVVGLGRFGELDSAEPAANHSDRLARGLSSETAGNGDEKHRFAI